MTKQRDEQIARFTTEVYRRATQTDGNLFRIINALPPIARSLHRLFERQCNGFQDWQGNEDAAAALRAEKREARLIAEAKALAETCGAELYVQGDPRGWPLYLIFPGDLRDGETPDNAYTRGVGVPC